MRTREEIQAEEMECAKSRKSEAECIQGMTIVNSICGALAVRGKAWEESRSCYVPYEGELSV